MLKQDLMMLITAVVALIHTCGVLSAIHAVAGVRTPQGAIAWAISLLTFPYIALPLYWILGRNRFHGYVEALQRGALEQADRGGIAMILEGLRGHQVDLPPERAGDLQVLAPLSRVPYTQGNAPNVASPSTSSSSALHPDPVFHHQGRRPGPRAARPFAKQGGCRRIGPGAVR